MKKRTATAWAKECGRSAAGTSAVTRRLSSFRSKSRFTAERFWRAWKAKRCLCRWRCPASRRACASSKTSAATRRPKWRKLLRPRRSGLRQYAGTLALAAAASISMRITQRSSAYKQAILRETLERGGVHAPEEIAVLAGEPWAYRNRIRLAFDAEGSVGISRAAVARGGSHCGMPDCRAAAGESCAGCRRRLRGSSIRAYARPRFRSFAMRGRRRCWRV